MVYPRVPSFRCVLVAVLFLLPAPAAALPLWRAQTAGGESGVPAPQTGASAESVPLDENTAAERVPPKPGDICLQCGHAIGMDDPVYFVNGHRIPLHRDEHEHDLSEQLRRLAGLYEPAGAFLQAAARGTGLSPFWFFFGCYVLLGLVFAALCAHCALHKGLAAWLWFLAGLFFNLFGFLILLLRRAQAPWAPAGVPAGLHKICSTYAPLPCPKCSEQNHPSARACAGCGAALHPALESEVSRAGLQSS